MNIRFITFKGEKHLRAEDVAELLREFGATEETDVRIRLETLASSLLTPRGIRHEKSCGRGNLRTGR